MNQDTNIHNTQVLILRELLFAPAANYAELHKSINLDPGKFKFHISRLVKLGHVIKVSPGRYKLTIKGKEYANKLDTDHNTLERQPKVSVVLILSRNNKGLIEYLCQQRLKNPYYEFWGRLGGKVRWGESFEEAASRELEEETGLVGKFEFKLLLRKRDYIKDSDNLLEDKIFVIMKAIHYKGNLIESFEGGINKWMTQDELKSQQKYFESAYEYVEMMNDDTPYLSQKYFYNEEDY